MEYFDTTYIIIFALLLFLIIIVIVYIAKLHSPIFSYYKTSVKLPSGDYKLFYTDQNIPNKEQVLYRKIIYCSEYDISGKPDYIYKNNDIYLPVELKSGKINNKNAPNQWDMMQLAFYFLLIENVFDAKVLEGYLIYSDAMFVLKNTKKLKKHVITTLKDMRDMLKTGDQEATSDYKKCRTCICRGTVCEYDY